MLLGGGACICFLVPNWAKNCMKFRKNLDPRGTCMLHGGVGASATASGWGCIAILQVGTVQDRVLPRYGNWLKNPKCFGGMQKNASECSGGVSNAFWVDGGNACYPARVVPEKQYLG